MVRNLVLSELDYEEMLGYFLAGYTIDEILTSLGYRRATNKEWREILNILGGLKRELKDGLKDKLKRELKNEFK